jgi:hypothetical protein
VFTSFAFSIRAATNSDLLIKPLLGFAPAQEMVLDVVESLGIGIDIFFFLVDNLFMESILPVIPDVGVRQLQN